MKRLVLAFLLLAACEPVPPASNPNAVLPETDVGIETGAAAPTALPRTCYPPVPPELEPSPAELNGLPPCP